MVKFESAWQHRSDLPEIYAELPAGVKNLLSDLPIVWDDTKLLLAPSIIRKADSIRALKAGGLQFSRLIRNL